MKINENPFTTDQSQQKFHEKKIKVRRFRIREKHVMNSLQVSATLEDGQLICFVDGVKSIQRAVTNGPLIKLFSRDFGAVSFSQQLPKFLSQQIGGNYLQL